MKPTQLPEVHRPYDWQDKLVMRASVITCVLCFGIIVWGR